MLPRAARPCSRYCAALTAGLSEILAAVRSVDERTDGLEQALVANQAREQLNPRRGGATALLRAEMVLVASSFSSCDASNRP